MGGEGGGEGGLSRNYWYTTGPPTQMPHFILQGYGWHPLLVYTYQSNTWMIDDLDTFGVVVGEQLSVQSEREECAVPVAEHAAFATAIAEGNAARALHFDAQTNHNYLMAMLTDVDGCVGNNHDSSVDICDAWNLRGLQHQVRHEVADQAEVIGLLERCEDDGQQEAARAREGVPLEVWTSQMQAMRDCKDRAERTDRALSKTQSRLSPALVPQRTIADSVLPATNEAAKWWLAEGPQACNLFKWHVVQAQAHAQDAV